MKANELYQEGRLTDAIAAITEDVKRHPTNLEYRSFLCELLLISGELERADKQLDLIGHQNPAVMAGVALWRQLIRAEEARKQFYLEGRLPEFLDKPDAQIEKYLQASVYMRDNEMGEVQRLLEEAELGRVARSGNCNEQTFEEFRDLDDLTANIFEVLTSNGKYYWVPFSLVTEIRFYPPERPIDLAWRRATLEVELPGADGDVYMPATYFNNTPTIKDCYKLAHETEWLGAIPIMELEKVTFNT